MSDDDLKNIKKVIQDELVPIKKTLNEHTQKLNTLDEISDKVDTLLGDMIEVQKKTGATSKAIHEHNQREIEEIKDHLGLPFTPSPFKS